MNSPKQPAPGKNLGQGMLITSFALALTILTFMFDGWIEDQANPNQEPTSNEYEDGSTEVILQRNRQGHYVANGTINNRPATFLLDTGATDVAIPANVAREVGLNTGIEGRANTAGGIVPIYSTSIDELAIGNIKWRDVAASITPTMEGNMILLGMSALKQVEFTQRGETLTLKHFQY